MMENTTEFKSAVEETPNNMTPHQMIAGDELNQAVSTMVMGHTAIENYSTETHLAMHVQQTIIDRGFVMTLAKVSDSQGDGYLVMFETHGNRSAEVSARGATIAEAICLAALEAATI